MKTKEFCASRIDHILAEPSATNAKNALLAKESEIDAAIESGCFLQMFSTGSIGLSCPDEIPYPEGFQFDEEGDAIIYEN